MSDQCLVAARLKRSLMDNVAETGPQIASKSAWRARQEQMKYGHLDPEPLGTAGAAYQPEPTGQWVDDPGKLTLSERMRLVEIANGTTDPGIKRAALELLACAAHPIIQPITGTEP